MHLATERRLRRIGEQDHLRIRHEQVGQDQVEAIEFPAAVTPYPAVSIFHWSYHHIITFAP